MWDEFCELKARSLLDGFADAESKPPLEEEQAVANWLNQMLPYPGWELRLVGTRDCEEYWVVANNEFGYIYYANGYYSMKHKGQVGETLIESLTTLEMGL